VKRAIDIVLSLLLLLLLAPILISTAFMVGIFMGRPVLFRQSRPGRHGVPFELLKFRSMTEAHDERGEVLPDTARMTRLGEVLRRSSLDELPQLWNVAKGEMSVVGPRPLLLEYLPHYSPEQMRRHEVRPGMTGLAQIHGRDQLEWPRRLEMDVWYVDHRSFWLDAKIIAASFWILLRGATRNSSAGLPKFTDAP
jgi:lipopolysaccharide/colanic/teichoic acid biosynthesis glycosyltransferase